MIILRPNYNAVDRHSDGEVREARIELPGNRILLSDLELYEMLVPILGRSGFAGATMIDDENSRFHGR